MVAEIIINSMAKQLNKTFDYIVPDNLINTVKIGNRVFVPFGSKNSATEGYIIGLKKNSDFANKEILKIEDSILTEENIELAKLMSKRYFSNISECIKLMLPPGEKSTNLTNRIKDKKANFVYLKKDIDEIELDIEIKKIKSPKHIKILQFLIENEGIYIADLEAITETSRAVLKTLEKNGYIEIVEQKVSRDIFKNREIKRDKPLKLTEEQQKAFNIIDKSKFDEFLIYGVTGSGKTEIYLQLIQSVINKGKTAIVLVPEISLTPQMVDRFLARFGDCIAVLHSKLSIGERNEQWKNLKEDKYKILIGARSAIFAPIKNLGIIIIDEEHDSSYKSDMSPKYNAKEIAKYIAKKNDIPLVLGSATPEITTYSKSKNIIELTKRANNSNLPTIEIVDLRKELANGNRSIISQKLHDEIEENYAIDGILIINGEEYAVHGEREIESEQGESESETEFFVDLGENRRIYVEQSIEEEHDEFEQEFSYSVRENGREVERSTFSYEAEDGETEIKMVTRKDGKTNVLYFEREVEHGRERLILRVDDNSYIVTENADGGYDYQPISRR